MNRYFHPDHSATSQMVSDLAFHLASRGWDVGVITSRQLYDEPEARLPRRENVRGVQILRTASSSFGRDSLVGRAFDYLTFALNAWGHMFAKRNTLLVAMTDPPLTSVLAALSKTPYINWVQDLFPDVAEALGVRAPGFLRKLRDWSLRRARLNVVIGEQMAVRVPRAVVAHNWAVSGGTGASPVHRADRRGACRSTMDDPFVVGYSGNLGRAHDVATMIGAMRLLRDDPRVAFKITGGGAKINEVRRENLSNVGFEPYAPIERLAESLASVDVHLVSLNPRLEGLIVPSKFYGVLAAARPVIYIGSREGELARLVIEHRIGYVVEPGEAISLASVIRELASSPELAHEMGESALALYRERFAAEIAFANWERILRDAMM